jgi:predicted GNAT superfamily acetyltransferase
VVDYEIIEIQDDELIYQVIEVQRLAWQRDDYSLVPPTLFKALATHGGTLFGAVTPNQQVIGYVFGFPALGKNFFLYHHSHQVGVLPVYQNQGIGTALKKKQLEHCQKAGFPVVTWTYDPLLAANSNLNFGHLHTIGRTYYVNYYGEQRNDIYNLHLPTDRLEVELWVNPSIEEHLKKIKTKLKQEIAPADAATHWLFAVNPLPKPEDVKFDTTQTYACVPIPGDFLIAKKTDLERLKHWRLVIRQVYALLIRNDYVAIEFWRSNHVDTPATVVWVKSKLISGLPPKFLENR